MRNDQTILPDVCGVVAALRLKTTIFLLDGANGEETEAENKDKNEHGVESDEERKHTRNDEEEDSEILKKQKMLMNPTSRKFPIRVPRLAGEPDFPARWKKKVWVPLITR